MPHRPGRIHRRYPVSPPARPAAGPGCRGARCRRAFGRAVLPAGSRRFNEPNGYSDSAWGGTGSTGGGGSSPGEVHAVGAGKCLDVPNSTQTNGTQLDIYDCNGGANQQWNINTNGTITGVQSGLCLDVTGASTANGALVELWTCNGGSNQQWKLGT